MAASKITSFCEFDALPWGDPRGIFLFFGKMQENLKLCQNILIKYFLC